MKIYITSFNNIRYFTSNMIPVSTAGRTGWPYWLFKADNKPYGTPYLNKNNVMIGICEKKLAFNEEHFEKLTEQCQKDCPYAYKAPNCQFMQAYYRYLCSQDFNSVVKDLEKIAEDVKLKNNFIGEPKVVLMVYEAASRLCGERFGLVKWFKDNGYDLIEWTPDIEEKEILF